MAGDSERQICGNCGAPNEAGAVTCIVCGVILSAYAVPSQPSPIPESLVKETTTTTTTTSPPDPPATSGGDWRTMFDSKPIRTSSLPETPRDLELDYRNDLPQTESTTTTAPPIPSTKPVETPRAVRESPTQPTAPPAEPERRGMPPRAKATTRARPGVDPRFNHRRPQSIIAVGAFLLLMGCVVSIVLSAAGAGDVAVALAFLCLAPLGFIAILAGIVISISRKEGRGG